MAKINQQKSKRQRKHKCSPTCNHSRQEAIPITTVCDGFYSKLLSDRRKAFRQNLIKKITDNTQAFSTVN